jgi:hypothetical protein
MLPLAAQQVPYEPVKIGDIVFSGNLRNRLENWKWFTPSSADPKYTFNGSTLRFGFSENLKAFDWMLELEAPILLNLPDNAVAPGVPGQLGQGAAYFVSNHREKNVAMLFPKQANIRFHKLFGSEFASLKLGRFEFMDGSEVAAKDPTMAVIKRDRIFQRLLGPFVFTDVMRGFDGLHFVYNKPKINYTFVGAVPTRGVSQVDGWGWLHAAFGYASGTGQVQRKSTVAEWRVFGIQYNDWRHVLKTDNRSAAAKAADMANIRIFTAGAHYVQVTKTSVGSIDLMGEVALQTGRWGVQDHRAGMVDLEAGYQPKILPRLKPWVRGGFYYGSGDNNPNDGTHGTFFQILPTARPYARFPFFDMENNEDRFGMITLRPHARITLKSEVHSLALANRNDLWYAGGGAFQPWTFGYQGRAANGAKSLALLYDLSLDVTVNPHFSVSPYIGYASGRSVIRTIYPQGKDGHLLFLETTYRF